jgi:hypothetical protein
MNLFPFYLELEKFPNAIIDIPSPSDGDSDGDDDGDDVQWWCVVMSG